jgi:hypothetical protein
VARRPLEQSEVVPLLLAELRSAPELWAQKGYLARAVSLPPDAPALDDGIQPLAHVVDADGPDRVAVTVELDERERVHPVVYVRRGGEVADHVLAPHPVHAFDSAEHAAALDALVSPLMKVAARA